MSLSQADQLLLDRRVRGLVSDALIEEHRAHPFGPHSLQLIEVMQFLRRNPDPDLPRYVVLRISEPPRWAIGALPAARGGAMQRVNDVTYESRATAEHGVFLRRLADYGLIASTGSPAGAADATTAPLRHPLPGVLGYVDALSVAPGDSLTLHVSSTGRRWQAQLVRLLCSELGPEGPPLREAIVADVACIEREAIPQRTPVGSFVRIDIPSNAIDLASGLSIRCFVMPTLPGNGPAALISHRDATVRSGWSLLLNKLGAPSLRLGTCSGELIVELDEPLVRGCWYLIAAVIDVAGSKIQLACRPVGTRAANRVWIGRGRPQRKSVVLTDAPRSPPTGPLLLACGWLLEDLQPCERFDGRLELPMLIAGAVDPEQLLAFEDADSRQAVSVLGPLAAWDFSAGIDRAGFRRTRHVEDLGSQGWHGRCVNHPTRAVTSHSWDSANSDFRHAPAEYAAAHFHRDDMTDCAWTPQARIEMPADLPSGVYAWRLKTDDASGEQIDRVPFVVRPPRGRATAPLLLIMSTNSYLAYANDHVAVDSPRVQMMVRRVLQFDEFDLLRHQHRELGASLYEAHPDGTGICYSSWRRPILTMRPQVETFNGRAWQFTADMQIIDWLDRSQRKFDVVTDLDVHRQGPELLRRYRCVMTGTHPEYPTRQMLDAFGEYLDQGGRFVYSGGNGFYWVTGYDPEDDQVIEIRRWGGSEAWRARPGEYHLSFTGEPGGLWRNRGRAPQKTVGVGFVASGLVDAGAPYGRTPAGDPRASWVLKGVTNAEFGARGTSGPAAGLELDAVDPELGSPAEAILLASSGGRHGDDMLEARENYGMTLAAAGGARNARVRADIVLVPWSNGGGVFSTGSIAWAGALAHDADVSRIMANVLDRFCSGAALLD
jgi:N,N-dimethylformamidase